MNLRFPYNKFDQSNRFFYYYLNGTGRKSHVHVSGTQFSLDLEEA